VAKARAEGSESGTMDGSEGKGRSGDVDDDAHASLLVEIDRKAGEPGDGESMERRLGGTAT
jgi:hypothetical protein